MVDVCGKPTPREALVKDFIEFFITLGRIHLCQVHAFEHELAECIVNVWKRQKSAGLDINVLNH
jgi:hypothetical protein